MSSSSEQDYDQESYEDEVPESLESDMSEEEGQLGMGEKNAKDIYDAQESDDDLMMEDEAGEADMMDEYGEEEMSEE